MRREALRLDHRADIVDDRPRDNAGAREAEDGGEQPAARGTQKNRLTDPEGGEAIDDIAQFDLQIVVAPVGIILRQAPPAIIQSQHAALVLTGDTLADDLEILGVTGQAGQADHREQQRSGIADLADMQLEAICRAQKSTAPLRCCDAGIRLAHSAFPL